MTIADVFETSNHRTNIAHFKAIVNLALVNGDIKPEEDLLLERFAKKLDISPEEYKQILQEHEEFPCIAVNSCEERLKHLYNLFRIIYSDHLIEDGEKDLILKYAIGLGVPLNKVEKIIEKSIQIFSGNIKFTDYYTLVNR